MSTDTPTPLRVKELHIQNFLGIRAVDLTIDPDTSQVIIGGQNGQGKTSVLNGIESALRGKRFHPEEPVRRGKSKASVEIHLNGLLITRTWKPDGSSTLRVEDDKGLKVTKPQDRLDRLATAISFDPTEFPRMEPAAQVEMIRQLAGIDLEGIDLEKAGAYAERTEANREAKRLTALLERSERVEGVPDEEVTFDELQAERDALEAERDELRVEASTLAEWNDTLSRADVDLADLRGAVVNAEQALKDAQLALADAEGKQEKFSGARNIQQNKVDGLRDIDAMKAELTALKGRWDAAGATNEKIRANRAHDAIKSQHEAARRSAADLERELERIADRRAELIDSAALPVDGLAWSEVDGVTLGGIPFSQISAAEQLTASVAIAQATDPQLKVMLVRDGSLLDDESMRHLAQLAEDAGSQLWIERVGDGDAGAIVIKDGQIWTEGAGDD